MQVRPQSVKEHNETKMSFSAKQRPFSNLIPKQCRTHATGQRNNRRRERTVLRRKTTFKLVAKRFTRTIANQRSRRRTNTGLSKRNGAKFREFSRNFPKLADWAVYGRSLFLAALGARIFKQGTILLHYPVYVACRVQVPPISVL